MLAKKMWLLLQLARLRNLRHLLQPHLYAKIIAAEYVMTKVGRVVVMVLSLMGIGRKVALGVVII